MDATLILLLDTANFVLAVILVAMGLVIIFGLMRIINMAHGELFLLGAYTVLVVQQATDSFWLGLIAAPIAVGLVGLVIEILVVRFVYSRFLDAILATWGLSIVIKQAVVLTFGPQSQVVAPPFDLSLTFLGAPYPAYRLFIMAASLCVIGATLALFLMTEFGLKARATIADRKMAECLGIDIRAIDRRTFALGAALAGFAGAVMAPIMSVDPYMGLGFLVPAFLSILVGGAGNLLGPLGGAAIIGGGDTILSNLLSPVAAQIIVLAIAIIVIRLFPQGLAGRSGRGS
ncbi:MAG: branched-chain amino acid ABC transporter permease [Pseudomonadota bacterium]